MTSSSSRSKRDICRLERLFDDRGDIGAAKMLGRNVDGKRQALRQSGKRAAGFKNLPFADSGDKAGAFGQRDELDRRQQPVRRMVPADQRLQAGRRAVGGRDHGLVVEQQFIALQRFGELDLQLAPLVHLGVHAGFEEAVAAAPVCLGAVECQIGVAHDLVGLRPVERRDRNAEAEPDRNLVSVDRKRQANLFDQPRRQVCDVVRIGTPASSSNANSSPPSRATRSLLRTSAPSRLADLDQQPVARLMAEPVVDRLELVEVEVEQRERGTVRDRDAPRIRRAAFENVLGFERPVSPSL